MKRKIIILLIVILILSGMGLVKAKEWHDNSVVDFADETMGQVLCEACYMGSAVTVGNVTYNDLKNIGELRIGYVGNYDTLMDIQYCTGVQELSVTGGIGKLSEQDIETVQQELGKILPKLKKLKWLSIGSEEKEGWTSIEFLRNQDSIEKLWIGSCKATDYSVLQTCTSLKEIKIEYSDISQADDLIGLKKLESIIIYSTPLAENPEEVKKLQEAYPGADIRY